MTPEEQQKITRMLGLLLNLKLSNGCMPGEVEVAAYKIGTLVQKYGLVISFPSSTDEQSHARAETSEQRAERQRREANQKFEEEIRRAREHAEQRRRERSQYRPSPSVAYIEVMIIGETEKALLCRSQEDETEFWIPRSQCREGCERWKRGDSGVLHVSQWWAEKEGWV